MTDGDDEVSSEEDVDFAELHPFFLVEVTRRPEHDQERLAVTVRPGPEVGLDRIAHGRLRQAELAGHRGQLFVVGLDEFHPGEPAALRAGMPGSFQVGGLRPLSVDVDGAVRDHGPTLYARRRSHLSRSSARQTHQPPRLPLTPFAV